MKPFKKRMHSGPIAFLSDWASLLGKPGRLMAVLRGKTLSAPFRERLMLAVTQVNQCRYCAHFHTKAALGAGVASDEVRRLLAGEFEGCPGEELPAIVYAHHWAETGRNPEPEMRRTLQEVYGAEKAGDIELALQLICACNYTGNALDYALYRLSFGTVGG